MKIVLDTNVLIAAFIARGVCVDLFEHCAINHDIILSDFIINETKAVFTSKFKRNPDDVKHALELIRSHSELVSFQSFPTPVCRDSDDDNILATAVAGNAECIITGDEDLLTLKSFQEISIISPREFVNWETKQD